MIRQRLIGLAATLGIGVLLVGLPLVLLQVGFGTLPTITSWSDLVALLLSRDDGTLALLVIKALGWITWALLTGLILLEVLAQVRGLQPRDLPGLRLPQVAARQLVAAAAALFVALPGPMVVAHADPLPAPTVTATQTVTSAPVRTAASTATQVLEDAPAVPVQTRQHTVKRGESLWSIAAAELGNGRRYTEIAALNTRLLDGKDDDFLRPGWILTLPADDTNTAADTAEVENYTVRKGDTLSEIARDHLGDAHAYPKIFEASRTITQPGGRHLTDPDVIDIGWTLRLPASTSDATSAAVPAADPADEETAAPQSAAAHPEPVTQPPVPPVTGSASAAPVATATAGVAAPPASATAPDAAPATDETDAGDADHLVEPGWLVAGLTGAGALLAGSLWLGLRRLRAAQFRARRPGRMIATPSPQVIPVEKTLATSGAAALPTVEFTHEVLRRLAARQGRAQQPLPRVAAVELSERQLTLHLREAADLPAPWATAPDPLRWAVSTSVDPDLVGPDDVAVQAPYQQLVTLGTDDDQHLWLVNLEEAGVTRLTGDPDQVRDYARFIAAEMVLHPWTVDVRVECVGVGHEIVTLNPRRVRHHTTDDVAAQLVADAVALVDRTTAVDTDVATARATLLDHDLWEGRLLLLDTENRSATVEQLAELLHTHPGRTGTALVLVGDTHAEQVAEEVHLTAGGRVQLPSVGLDLVAVGLTSREAAGCATLYAQADPDTDQAAPVHSESVEGWRAHADLAGQLLPDHTLPRDTTPTVPAASLLPAPDHTYLQAAATTTEDLGTLAPHVPATVRDRVEHDDPTLDDDLRTWHDPRCDLPKVSVLGPVKVRVAPSGQPTVAADRRPYLTEIVAYLVTRPHGATTDELVDALGISSGRVRKDMLNVRAWLGTNPRTGRPHLPDSRQTDAARQRGRNTYQLEDVLVDADLFRRLRVRGEARGPEGLDDLRAALALVAGIPFEDLRANGGTWLYDGDRLDQILLCAIVDVGHLVTTAALAAGDLDQAQQATELALRAAPHEETPRLDLAAILIAQGHQTAAERLLRDEVCNRGDDEDGGPTEIPARTGQVIAEHEWLTRPKIRPSA